MLFDTKNIKRIINKIDDAKRRDAINDLTIIAYELVLELMIRPNTLNKS